MSGEIGSVKTEIEIAEVVGKIVLEVAKRLKLLAKKGIVKERVNMKTVKSALKMYRKAVELLVKNERILKRGSSGIIT